MTQEHKGPADIPGWHANENQADKQALIGVDDRNTGMGARLDELTDHMAAGSEVTGGDMDANQEQAKVVGEEAVGGTTPTPDQNVVEDIANSVGVEFYDKQPVRVKETLDRRDEQRWELDPDSREQRKG